MAHGWLSNSFPCLLCPVKLRVVVFNSLGKLAILLAKVLPPLRNLEVITYYQNEVVEREKNIRIIFLLFWKCMIKDPPMSVFILFDSRSMHYMNIIQCTGLNTPTFFSTKN